MDLQAAADLWRFVPYFACTAPVSAQEKTDADQVAGIFPARHFLKAVRNRTAFLLGIGGIFYEKGMSKQTKAC